MRWTLVIAIVASLLGTALGIGLTWAELGPYAQPPDQLIADGDARSIDVRQPPPKAVVVGSDTYNFGYMELDTKGAYTFEIRNEGDAPLKLAKGSTTCKCTLSNLQNDHVKPGESAKVQLEWTASTEPGLFRHSATIRTNDPRHQYLTLTIEGRVSKSHKVVPPQIQFGRISVGDGATAKFDLYSFESGDLKIKKHAFGETATAEYFELRTEEMPADQVAKEEDAKAGKTLTVVVKPGLPLGPLRQTILLALDLPGEPTVQVPIEGRVLGDISIVGPREWDDEHNLLTLGTIKSGSRDQSQGMHLLVKGKHRDEVNLKVRSIKPEFLKIHFDEPQPVPGEDVLKIPLTVEVPPDAPAGEHDGTLGPFGNIELDTGHPTTPRLKMYVNFKVER